MPAVLIMCLFDFRHCTERQDLQNEQHEQLVKTHAMPRCFSVTCCYHKTVRPVVPAERARAEVHASQTQCPDPLEPRVLGGLQGTPACAHQEVYDILYIGRRAAAC